MKTVKITAAAFVAAALIVVGVLLMRGGGESFNDFATAAVGLSYGDIPEADTENNEALHKVFDDISQTEIASEDLGTNNCYIATYKENGTEASLFLVYCMSVKDREYYIYADSVGKFYRLGDDAVTSLLTVDTVRNCCINCDTPRVVLVPSVSEGERFILPAARGYWNYYGADGSLEALDVTSAAEPEPIAIDVGLYDYSFICTLTPDSMVLTLTDEKGVKTSEELSPSQKISIFEPGKTYTAELECVWSDKTSDCFGDVVYSSVVTVSE